MSEMRETAFTGSEHVFEHAAGYWVIAATPEEAAFFYRRHQERVVGEEPDAGLLDPTGWVQMADGEPFTFDFQGPIPDGEKLPEGVGLNAGGGTITATAAAGAWARARGPGFFATEHL